MPGTEPWIIQTIPQPLHQLHHPSYHMFWLLCLTTI